MSMSSQTTATIGKIHDILVVGAGPVGCRVAAEVARAGYDVVIMEQKPSLDSRICCTALVSDECLKRFDLAPELIAKSFDGAMVFPPAGEAISVRRDRVQAHALGRPALDRRLYQVAMAHGAQGLFGARVTALLPDDDGIIAKVSRDGLPEEVRARAAVLAAGFGSRLPGSLGLKSAADWTIGVQAEAEMAKDVGVEVYVGRTFAPGFFAWLVPVAPNRAHIGLMARRRAKANFVSFLERLCNSGKVEGSTPPDFRGITLGLPPRTYGERFLVAGDLAGQVKPLTGGGLYFGLLCADIAARHLTAALGKDDLSARALAAYEQEWRALLERELRLGRHARRAFELLGDRQLGFLFGLARRYALAERLARSDDIGFDWHGAALSRAWCLLNPFNLKECK